MLETNIAEVVAEITAVFERYEQALLANDLVTLRELFWDDERVVRFGPDGAQYGAVAVHAHRSALARQTLPRSLGRTVITTFGRDFATIWVEFLPDGQPHVGRQSQA